MDCWRAAAPKFRKRFGFEQYDLILTKEESVLTKLMILFEEEQKPTQYYESGSMIDFYFHEYKLAKGIYENYHDDRNINYKIKRQKKAWLRLYKN